MEAAQRAAAAILHQVLRGKSLAGLQGKPPAAAGRDAALVQELVYGSLRWWGRIDALARRLYHKQPPRLEVRCLIGVALYQLLETSAPEFAVVDQAVLAVGRAGFPGAKGLVNALLREFLRRRAEFLPSLENDLVAYYSHPDWWIRRLRQDHPDHWRAVLATSNLRPPLTLRVQRTRTSQEAFLAALQAAGVDAVAVGDAGVTLVRPQPVTTLPGFAQGWFAVQDAGAQHAARLLGVEPGQRVLDACAAPGGKTAQLLETLGIEVTALDQDGQRLIRLRENLARLGVTARVLCGDARQPKDWWDRRPFERILVDAPCSSSGVARRHPDIKWLRRETDLEALARTQGEILDALWPLLARQGRLLYATCSLFRAENHEVTARFLCRRPGARQLPLLLTESAEGQLLPVATEPAHNHDGFYYALFEKP